jgi:hypothetical protein
MEPTKAIKDWMECVQQAKKNLGKGEKTFTMVKGSVLKEAQKCYCAKGY